MWNFFSKTRLNSTPKNYNEDEFWTFCGMFKELYVTDDCVYHYLNPKNFEKQRPDNMRIDVLHRSIHAVKTSASLLEGNHLVRHVEEYQGDFNKTSFYYIKLDKESYKKACFSKRDFVTETCAMTGLAIAQIGLEIKKAVTGAIFVAPNDFAKDYLNFDISKTEEKGVLIKIWGEYFTLREEDKITS